jgi:hypothetical protein
MFGKMGKKRTIILVACVCALLVVMAAVFMPHPSKGDSNDESDSSAAIGYKLSSKVLSESFTSSPFGVNLEVNNEAGTYYTKSPEGLKIYFNTASSSLFVNRSSTAANSVRCVVNVSSVDDSHFLDLRASFTVRDHPSWYYSVLLRISPNMVQMIPLVWLGTGTPDFQYFSYTYDTRARGTLDVVVEVENGNIVVGVDGFEKTLKTDYMALTDLMFGGVTLSSYAKKWSSQAAIVLERLELGNYARIDYHDRLHKTVTPWGHDFTLALQVHADSANPAQLNLMNDLAQNYGVRGEFYGWMTVQDPTVAYSITSNASYASSLLSLQQSGWDIGLHTPSQDAATRDEMLTLIGQFEEQFGPNWNWVDHGIVPQDIWQFGNDPSSIYYISDFLKQKNVTIWVNREDQSHSQAQDLNLDTVLYHNDSFPGLDLLRVSRFYFQMELDNYDHDPSSPITQEELSDRQSIYAANSAVLVWHDYTWRFVYVEDGGTNYSRLDHASIGYPYAPIPDEEYVNSNTHPNGTWHLLPAAEDYFAAMYRDYDVWYATPREVYDRSIIINQVDVSENATSVTVTNPTTSNISGFTLFTKEKPSYSLHNSGTYYYAHQGAENNQFVIPDVPAGASIVLNKTEPPSFVPTVKDASVPLTGWGDQSELFLRANRDGNVVLSSKVPGGNDRVMVDLSNDQEIAYADDTPIPVTGGHIYKIYRK